MPNFAFDKKFGNVHVATHPMRVKHNLKAFDIPLQFTKGSQMKVSGVKMPKFYVLAVFAADRPMMFRIRAIEDIGKLPGIFDPVKPMLVDFVGGAEDFYPSHRGEE